MFFRVKSAFADFVADSRALVTVQVVIFTIMLFASIGMVIDFGRAYSAHSQMQSYIDNVALAAARELDQRSATDNSESSIDRATLAAASVQKQNFFSTNTSGGSNFKYGPLVFLSGAPTDADGVFDASKVNALRTTDPTQATHVLAVAEQATVRTTLLRFSLGGSETVESIPVGTYAVATSRRASCKGVSTLVMCNPFEGDSDRSFASTFQEAGGMILKVTSDPAIGLSVTADRIGMGLIKNPVDTLGTSSGACEDFATLPGYSGQTGAELEKLRDECLLAVVDTGLSCVNDTLQVKEAPPSSIVTGLNVMWDMYDGGLASVLASDIPLADGRMRSEVFLPDLASVNGRLQRGYLAGSPATDEIDGFFNEMIEDAQAELAAASTTRARAVAQQKLTNANRNYAIWRAAYPKQALTPAEMASRMNRIPSNQDSADFGPMDNNQCLDTNNCAGSPHPAMKLDPTRVTEYIGEYYTPIARELEAVRLGIPVSEVPNTAHWEALSGGNVTLYGFYSNVELKDNRLWNYGAANGVRTSTRERDYVRTWPDNFDLVYGGTYGSDDYAANERRKVRVSVVNCGEKTGVAGSTDTYEAEVVDVVDLFMIKPPQVRSCDTAFTSTTDPAGALPCQNDDITKSELYFEYVASVNDQLAETSSRTYAVLVH